MQEHMLGQNKGATTAEKLRGTKV